MEGPEPWYVRAKTRFLRLWRTRDPKVAAVRDILVAGFVVLLLLSTIWIYTSQPFPSQAPLVVVESGSMMHGKCPSGRLDRCGGPGSEENPGFGRVGTIDPGDLVLVKDVDRFEDVETAFGFGSRSGYGSHGDVIVFRPKPSRDASPASTPIIHRAMLLVRVNIDECRPNDPINPCIYTIPETCHPEVFERFVLNGSREWRDYCTGSAQPITLRLQRDGVYLNLADFPCAAPEFNRCRLMSSGFLTKGDNNLEMDQPMGPDGFSMNTCCPVGLGEIIGKARGEIPWFGLIKLSLYGNPRYACDASRGQPCSDPTLGPQWRVMRAVAPRDTWLALFLSVGLLIAIPIAIDQVMHRVRKARAEGAEKRPPPSK